MNAKLRLILPVIVGIVALDHVTKWWIDSQLRIGDRMTVIPDFFDIVHVRNFGSAFGFLSEAHPLMRGIFFTVSTLIALAFLVYYFRATPQSDKGTLIALAFILAGALGNVSDRLIRGSVVDFLYFHWKEDVWTGEFSNYAWSIPLSWPSFNVADIAITSGVILLLLLTVNSSSRAKRGDPVSGLPRRGACPERSRRAPRNDVDS